MSQNETNTSAIEAFSDTVEELVRDLKSRDSPVTSWVILAMSLVFLGQQMVAIRLGASILGITSYFFLEYPVVAWTLSFFLHKDIMHFLGNVFLIGLVGSVIEQFFSTRSYLLFLLCSAVLSGIGAVIFKLPFTSQPVAAYGASGFGFALVTYSLYLPLKSERRLADALQLPNLISNMTLSEHLAFLLGISAIVSVVIDILSGPVLTTEWVNGAHFAGAVVGLVVGKVHPPTDSR